MTKRIIALTSFVIAALLAAGSLAAQNGSCDRACLEGLVDQYVDALIAHQPGKLPVAPRYKNTEDGVRLEVKDGFWRTAIGKGSYRLINTDTLTGNVVFHGTMREEPNGDVAVMVRLKVANKQITEIENFVARDAAAAARLNARTSDPMFTRGVPAEQRASRADLIKVADSFLAAIEKGKGGATLPVADDCVRYINGSQASNNAAAMQELAAAAGGRGGAGKGKAGAPKGGAPKGGVAPKGGAAKDGTAPKGGAPKAAAPKGPAPAAAPAGFNVYELSCADQLKSGYFATITRVRDRRYVAVDPTRGLVTVIYAMDEPSGSARNITVNGKAMESGPTKPTTVAMAETFKIEGGKIRRSDAIRLSSVPYGIVMGWSSFEDGMSSKAQDVK